MIFTDWILFPYFAFVSTRFRNCEFSLSGFSLRQEFSFWGSFPANIFFQFNFLVSFSCIVENKFSYSAAFACESELLILFWLVMRLREKIWSHKMVETIELHKFYPLCLFFTTVFEIKSRNFSTFATRTPVRKAKLSIRARLMSPLVKIGRKKNYVHFFLPAFFTRYLNGAAKQPLCSELPTDMKCRKMENFVFSGADSTCV